MADPIVGITNGVPTSGTGTITTLGQTLLDGANITYGASTDAAVTAGAAGSVSAKLRSISRDIAGGIVLQAGANTIGAVTQAGAPWSVAGTLAVTQSGSWNIANITGTVSLPTGAATAANQPSNAGQASTTAGQTGHLAMGATTTSAPSYTTGQTNPLSLTPAGALRVDGSGVTQTVSGTVAISGGSIGVTGTVPVSQSGVWTMQPGNTANATPWLMTVNQGGNSATVSAAGALKVDGSAVTQPVSAASLPLPTGAATAANQATAAAQGSTTSGQTGTLAEGAVATAAPSYTNGTTQPVSLTITGAIRVDGSATTQPVSGTVTANQGGNWNQRLQDGSGNAISSDARGTARPLAVEILDAAGNQITSFGGGSGGSAFGSAVPTSGSAVGFSDGTNLQMARVFDGDIGVGTQYDLGVLLKTPASGGAVDIGVAGQPLRVDPTGTTTQPVSLASTTITGTVAVTQSGAWNITNVTGTVSLPTGASTSANQPSNAGIGSATSGQTGNLSFGAVTTSAPSYTTAQSNPLSLTTAGALRVDGSGVTQPISGNVGITGTIAATQSGTWNINNVSGTVSLPTGAATSANQPTNAALGSTTSGQTGSLGLGAVTSATPSYTTATTNALSLTTAGALRVDATATTQPVSGTVTASQGGVWTIQPGNTANTTPWLASISQGGNTAAVTAASALKVDGSAVTQPISGTIAATQSGNWTVRNVGNVGGVLDFAGQNAAAPANALLMGGEFNTTPTTITSGNASPLQLDSAGNLLVNIKAGAAAGGTSSSFGAAIPGTGTASGFSDGANMQLARVFDGDSGAGTQYSLGVLLKTPASGGAVDIGVAGQPIRIDPTGTTTQPVSGSVGITGTVAATQSGTWNITNISGTVSLPTGAATAANQATAAAIGSTTSGQTGNLAFGAVTAGAPSYTTAQSNALSLTTAGALRVDGSAVTQPISGNVGITGTATVSGTVTANQGGTWNITNISGTVSLPTGAATSANQPTAAAIASTTAGQTGNLAMGAVTTASPSYTTATTNNLSLTTAGALRIDGSAVTQPVSGTFWQATQPVSIAAAVTVQQPTAANLNATVTGTVAATQSGTWTDRIVGSTGGAFDFASTQNIASPAQCILTGGEFNTTPTTITSGNSSPLQLDNAGNLLVNLKSSIVLPASQSGTWTVQPGNTQNTTPWLTRQSQTAASNGLTASRVVAAATTNATSLKASAGNIAAIDLFNVAAYMVFLKLYNKASAPTVGTDTPVWTIPIPASGGYSIVFNEGEYFSTGIAFAITKLQADSDATAIAAGDVTGRIKWV